MLWLRSAGATAAGMVKVVWLLDVLLRTFHGLMAGVGRDRRGRQARYLVGCEYMVSKGLISRAKTSDGGYGAGTSGWLAGGLARVKARVFTGREEW